MNSTSPAQILDELGPTLQKLKISLAEISIGEVTAYINEEFPLPEKGYKKYEGWGMPQSFYRLSEIWFHVRQCQEEGIVLQDLLPKGRLGLACAQSFAAKKLWACTQIPQLIEDLFGKGHSFAKLDRLL